MNYTKAVETLNGRDRRKIDNNTYLEKRPGAVAVRLHATDVLTFYPDGATVYNSGGWRTVTTKARMNEYGAGVQISQARGVWFIGERVYKDGCKVTGTGAVIGAEALSAVKKSDKLVKAIKKYTSKYMDAFIAGKIPAPSNGDCWGCLMVAEDGTAPLGRGGDHIRQHIKENYFVPSMITRAAKKYGASVLAQNYFATLWNNPEGREASQWERDIARDQLGRILYRWIKAELALAS